MLTKKNPYLYKKTLKRLFCILPSRQAIYNGTDRQSSRPSPMRDFKPSIYLKKTELWQAEDNSRKV